MQKIREKIQEKATLVRSAAHEAKKEIDAKILALKIQSIEQFLKRVEESKERFEAERDVAVNMALKILGKAKEVRENLKATEIVAATNALKNTVLTTIQTKPASKPRTTTKKARPKAKSPQRRKKKSARA